MKNTILFSLLLLMTFCCESAFARSDKWVIHKTERVGNDTAEWKSLGKSKMLFISFKKEMLKVAKLSKEPAKGSDWDFMSYIVFDSKKGVQSQYFIQKLFVESLTQTQITELFKEEKSVNLSLVVNGKGRIVAIEYLVSVSPEEILTSEQLYQINKKIKRKVRFGKPSDYGYKYARYTLGRISEKTLERYLKEE